MDGGNNMNVRENSDLRKVGQKKFNKWVLIYLIIGFICIVGAFLIDIYSKYMENITNEYIEQTDSLSDNDSKLKQKFLEDREKHCNLIMTLNTILAAAVIFFYSIQDSRRGGVPNRTILAYTFGSFTIPVLFTVALVIMPFYYVADSFDWSFTVYASLIFTYIIQMMIVIFILTATSYQYSIYAITNVEIRQFQALKELDKKKENRQKDSKREKGQSSAFLTYFQQKIKQFPVWKKREQKKEHKQKNLEKEEEVIKREIERNSVFSWTYLQHNLEQVIMSDELVVDKLTIARSILRVPYYQGEIKLRKEPFAKKIRKKLCRETILFQKNKISIEKIQDNNLKRLYEFYYGNILAIFKHIDQPQNLEYRNKLYLILYEFLEELTKLYDNEIPGYMKKGKDSEKNYVMTISGIINAVLSSNVEEAEGFCNYVFNNVISKSIWNIQISLYFLFQEYLYRTNRNNSEFKILGNIDSIIGISEWKNNIKKGEKKDSDLHILFWEIWMGNTTILPEVSLCYYNKAMKAFKENGNIDSPISYITKVLIKKGEYI